MKWVTHSTAGVFLALAAADHPLTMSCVVAGSLLPDVVDRLLSGSSKRLWARLHRGASHWFGWYLPGLVVPHDAGRDPAMLAAYGLALGAIVAHIGLDALNPSGVPLLPFARRPRLAVPLARTGGMSELVLFAAMTVLAMAAFSASTR